MNKKRNARPGAGTPGQAKEARGTAGSDPQLHCSTDHEEETNEFLVARLLPFGEENAIASAELVQALGLPGTRELQYMVNAERGRDMVICFGTHGGYYLPETRAEVKKFLAIMEARIKTNKASMISAEHLMMVPDNKIRSFLEALINQDARL